MANKSDESSGTGESTKSADTPYTEILPGLYRGLEGEHVGRTFQVTAIKDGFDGRMVHYQDVHTDQCYTSTYGWFAKPGRFARQS